MFLAFPAILPASLTLVAKHDGDKTAGIEAGGAAMGSVGLVAFGLVIWQLAPHVEAWLALLVATVAWVIASVAAWVAAQYVRAMVKCRSRETHSTNR